MKENVSILKLNMVFSLKNKNLNLNSHMWEFTCRSDGYDLKELEMPVVMFIEETKQRTNV